MNRTARSERVTPTSTRTARYFGAVAIAIAIAVVSLASSGCRGGSNDFGHADSGRTGAASVLDAVTYVRPSVALADPSDPTLVDYGDLLFNGEDLTAGYVLGTSWCDRVSARCVEVSGDRGIEFGGKSLKSFVVETEYSVDGSGLEVVDLRALHHPVSDQIRMILEVKPRNRNLSADYEVVQVRTATDEFATFLDGPSSAAEGMVTRYELITVVEPVSGPSELVVTFSDRQFGGDQVQITIDLDDSAPEIDRPEAPLGERSPVAIYRVNQPLSAQGDYGGEAALAELITAIIDGVETIDLVKPDSPGASAVAALAQAGRLVTFRHDPDDAAALCWQSDARGTFCERWHGAELERGVLTSWSVEGTAIDDLVVTRTGSGFGATMTLVRSPSSDVVLAVTTVANTTETVLGIPLDRVVVERGGVIRRALEATGGVEIPAQTTATSAVLLDAPDFDFDLIYSLSSEVDAAQIRFGADAPPAPPVLAPTSKDPKTASVRLASQLRKRRFTDALAMAAPGSPAAWYLQAIVATASATSPLISTGGEPAGSPRVCATTPDVACTTVEVTQVDDQGRIRDFTIEGIGVTDLVVADRSTENGGLSATIEQAALWPTWGVAVAWSATNSSEADIKIDSVTLVSPSGGTSESKRPLDDKLPPGRTVSGEAFFGGASFNASIEIAGSGRDTSDEVSAVVPLSPIDDRVDSND